MQEDYDLYPQVLEITEPVIQACSDDATEMDIDSSSGEPSSKSVYVLYASKTLGIIADEDVVEN